MTIEPYTVESPTSQVVLRTYDLIEAITECPEDGAILDHHGLRISMEIAHRIAREEDIRATDEATAAWLRGQW